MIERCRPTCKASIEASRGCHAHLFYLSDLISPLFFGKRLQHKVSVLQKLWTVCWYCGLL